MRRRTVLDAERRWCKFRKALPFEVAMVELRLN